MICSDLTKKENGWKLSSNINKIAVLVAQLYAKLPFGLTVLCVSNNIDPFYYFMHWMPVSLVSFGSILLRSALLLISWTESCRLVALLIFFALFVINLLNRETHMWIGITKRNRFAGLFFYRQIAILYTRRRMWATRMLTLVFTVGFVMQVDTHSISCGNSGLPPVLHTLNKFIKSGVTMRLYRGATL